jgi:hypothetical protein
MWPGDLSPDATVSASFNVLVLGGVNVGYTFAGVETSGLGVGHVFKSQDTGVGVLGS